MSFSVWCEIVCNKCSTTGSGRWSYSTIPRKDLAKSVKDRGWESLGDDWYCNGCKHLLAGEKIKEAGL